MLVLVLWNYPAVLGKTPVNQLRRKSDPVQGNTNMIRSDRYRGGTLFPKQTLKLQNAFAWNDHLLARAKLVTELYLGHCQAVTIGCDGPQVLALCLDQHSVQVVTDVLLGHRKMRFLQ